MKGIILIGLLILIIAVSGCSGGVTGDVVVCDSPYIRHAMGCCLDVNANKICDNDEITAAVEEPEDEEEEETEEDEENNTVIIPEPTAEIEGFEDWDIVLNDDIGEDGVDMAIELAKLIDYESSILPKSNFDITGYERIYLIKKKNTTISKLSEYIITVGDSAPNEIVSKARDLANGIGYIGGTKTIDEIDFAEYERELYLVTMSS